MPAGIALAATWNTDAAQRYGALVGDEAKHKGNDVLFGPAADLLRVPVAGRGFEGYGEDPWLASRMAVHYIRGVQQQGRSEEHTSELQSLMRISYAVFCLKKKKKHRSNTGATHK